MENKSTFDIDLMVHKSKYSSMLFGKLRDYGGDMFQGIVFPFLASLK